MICKILREIYMSYVAGHALVARVDSSRQHPYGHSVDV